jgi:hypothetical protein
VNGKLTIEAMTANRARSAFYVQWNIGKRCSDPDLVLPTGSVICDRRRCECLSDVRATRYVGPEAKKKWQETVRELKERMAKAPITRL